MSVDTNRYPLKNVPFPAVTICNVNKVSKEKLLEVLRQDTRLVLRQEVNQLVWLESKIVLRSNYTLGS